MGNWAEFGLLAAVLVTAAVADWRTGRIPNWITYPGALGAFTLAIALGHHQGGWGGAVDGLGWSFLGAAAGLIPMAVIFTLGGIGGGDAKLTAFIGAVATWNRLDFLLAAVVYGFFAGMIMAVGVMIRQRIVVRTLWRIIHAVLGTLGGIRPPMPDDSPKIPFGVALCVGGLLAGWEYLLHPGRPGWGWIQ